LHPIRPSANRGTHPRLLQRQRRTYTVLDLVRDELQTKVGAWRTRPGKRTASSRSSPTPPRRWTRTTSAHRSRTRCAWRSPFRWSRRS